MKREDIVPDKQNDVEIEKNQYRIAPFGPGPFFGPMPPFFGPGPFFGPSSYFYYYYYYI